MTLKDFLDQNQDLIAGADMIRFQVGFYNEVIPICCLQVNDLTMDIFDPHSQDYEEFDLAAKIEMFDNTIQMKNITRKICSISFFSLRPVKLRENP